MGQSDFKALLNVRRQTSRTRAKQSIQPPRSMERNRLIGAMSEANMSDVDIARQFSMSREEVQLILNVQQKNQKLREIIKMIKGLYSAVSAMVMNAARQQVLSHNIANLQTPGFKQISDHRAGDFMQNQAVYANGKFQANPMNYVGTLGLGTQIGLEYMDLRQGALQDTSNPLDFALQGNGFFVWRRPMAKRYTRDGRFLRDADNNLVTVEGF